MADLMMRTPVPETSLGRRQSMCHRFQRRRVLRGRRRAGEAGPSKTARSGPRRRRSNASRCPSRVSASGRRASASSAGSILPLVVGGLDHVVGDHQQAVGRHQGLGVVGKPPPATGMMRESASVRLTWSFGPGPATGGSGGRLAARLLGLLRARLDHRLGLGDAGQTILAPGQFLGHRHPVGHIRPIGRLRQRHQLRHLGGLRARTHDSALCRLALACIGAVQRHRFSTPASRASSSTSTGSGRENAAGTRRWYRGRDDRWPR